MPRAQRVQIVADQGFKAYGFWNATDEEQEAMLKVQQSTGLKCSSITGRGFHEKARLCQAPRPKRGRGIHKGAEPLLWGEPRFLRRGGNPPAPAFPAGETGKGRSDSLLPQALSPFVPIADSPCFHSHSLMEPSLRCHLGSSISTGAAISVSN